jgi:hypothetical protein
MPIEYAVIPWDQQIFLVEPSLLIAFCNDVNSGRLRCWTPYGRYPLRVEDFDKKRPKGLPRVPAEYEQYLLRKPITGTVVTIGKDKQDVAVWGENWLMSGTSVTLNVGKKDGVCTGMRFYAQGDPETAPWYSWFYVISLGDRECELLQWDDKKDRAKAGLRLSTVDPLFNRS